MRRKYRYWFSYVMSLVLLLQLAPGYTTNAGVGTKGPEPVTEGQQVQVQGQELTSLPSALNDQDAQQKSEKIAAPTPTSTSAQPTPASPLVDEADPNSASTSSFLASYNQRCSPNPFLDSHVGGNPTSCHTPRGNDNFTFTAPIINLAGRGLDVALNLTYNSHLWHTERYYIKYDINKDWPAPGFTLGFGKLVQIMNPPNFTASFALIEGNGVQRPFTGTIRPLVSGFREQIAYTTDGSFIDYTVTTRYNAPVRGQVKYASGTIVDFGVRGDPTDHFHKRVLYPTRITDAHGNYIEITYRNSVGPQIDAIIDTVGRRISFHYDGNGLLTAITAPALGDEPDRTLIRLHYTQFHLEYAFRNVRGRADGDDKWLIDAIYYPGDQTGYWFGDVGDSYSTYGMIATVSQRRAMVYQPGPAWEQGLFLDPGKETKRQTYGYPLYPPPREELPAYAPQYTEMRESWEWRDESDDIVTQYESYSEPLGDDEIIAVTTLPNGRRVRTEAYNIVPEEDYEPGPRILALNGLVYRSETNDDLGRLEITLTDWEVGDYNSPRPTREIQISQRLNLRTVTRYAYDGSHNQVTDVREYGYDGTELSDGTQLRREHTVYHTDIGYTSRHIFNLPTFKKLYQGNPPNETLVSQTEFKYDEQPPVAISQDIVHHDLTYNPNAPPIFEPPVCSQECNEHEPPVCYTVCEPGYWEPQFNPHTLFRGNVTQVKTYTDASALAGPITTNNTYDIAGNMVTSSSGCCQQTSVTYTAETQYAFATSMVTGAPNPDLSARLTTTSTYDLNTGLVLATKDPNNQLTVTDYDSALRVHSVSTKPLDVTDYDSSVTYDYNSALPQCGPPSLSCASLVITQTATDLSTSPDSTVSKTVQRMNGLGLARRTETLHDQSGTGTWDIVQTKYDRQGRVWKISRPFSTGQTPQYWTTNYYDTLSRIYRTEAPDGSNNYAYYDENRDPPSSASTTSRGHTVRTVDAWDREQWSRYNALGLLEEVVEPNPSGNGSVFAGGNIATSYQYDGNNNLTRVTQGPQHRTFRYDSLGRMTHQHLPERDARLNDSGGRGEYWSDVFTYDDYSNLTSYTDARGVRMVYQYANPPYTTDPLNRLQSVTYDTSGFNDINNPIQVAAPVAHQYETAGDITRVRQVNVGSGPTAIIDLYSYDTRGRPQTETTTFASRQSYPMTVDYSYDGAGRLKELTYPAQYEIAGTPRKVQHLSYDVASRISGLQIDGVNYASGINYGADGQATSILVGYGAQQLQDTYAYDPITGLMINQKVLRGVTTLFDLNYNYEGQGTSEKTGQLTGITNNLDPSMNLGYQYDTLGRLSRVTRGNPTTPQWRQNYGYDRYGNRTTVTATGSQQPLPHDGIASMSYVDDTGNNRNRITTPGFLYDVAGNLVRGQRADGTWQRYQYDAAGRLVKVYSDTEPFITFEGYTYGAGRERLATQLGSSAEARIYYAWSGGAVIAEYTDIGSGPKVRALAWSMSYISLGERLLATLKPNSNRSSEAVNFHHSDWLGTRLITSAEGNQTWEQETLPFGVALQLPTGSEAGNRLFTSYDRSSATGADYATNRWYDSQQGRFTQVDPLDMGAADLADPQSLNLYSYVQNDPVNRADPTGLADETCLGREPGTCFSFVDGTINNPPVEVGHGAPTPSTSSFVSLSELAPPPGGEYYGVAISKGSTATADTWWDKATNWQDWNLSGASNFTNGFADTVTFGAVGLINDLTGVGQFVDRDSGLYTTGEVAGEVWWAVVNAPAAGERSAARATRALGKGCSFSAETTVATSEGNRAISEIEPGDHVLAYDEETNSVGYYTVTFTLSHEDPIIEYVTIAGEQVETTPEHPFYTEEDGWVPAGALSEGWHVRRADGRYSTVERVEFFEHPRQMYDLTVAYAHTYFVGNQQILVHNCLIGKAAKDAAGKLGFKKINPNSAPFNSRGQPVFQRGNNYISPDIGSNRNLGPHNGGVWKMFNRRGERLGTYDANLNWIKD